MSVGNGSSINVQGISWTRGNYYNFLASGPSGLLKSVTWVSMLEVAGMMGKEAMAAMCFSTGGLGGPLCMLLVQGKSWWVPPPHHSWTTHDTLFTAILKPLIFKYYEGLWWTGAAGCKPIYWMAWTCFELNHRLKYDFSIPFGVVSVCSRQNALMTIDACLLFSSVEPRLSPFARAEYQPERKYVAFRFYIYMQVPDMFTHTKIHSILQV